MLLSFVNPCPRLAVVVAILALAFGCRNAPTGLEGEYAELLGARVPTSVPEGATFEVVGYFGRGACDVTRPEVVRTPMGVRMALLRVPARTDDPCIGVLLPDTVSVQVSPPFPLPFTVRLRRAGAPDSVIVVRAAR